MTLRRYNEILIAILATAAVIGIPALWVSNYVARHSYDPPSGIVPGGIKGEKGVPQTLSMCTPIVVPGSDVELFPVAGVRVDGSAGNVSVGPMELRMQVSSAATLIGRCDLPRDTSHVVFNVVARNIHTDLQTLVFDHPVLFMAVVYPPADCKPESSVSPCDRLLWSVRDEDTNHDGALDAKDAEALFVSGLSGTGLARLSPQGVNVRSWVWDGRSGELLSKVQRPRPDGSFMEQGAEEVLSARIVAPAEAGPVLQPEIVTALKKAVEGR